MYYERITPADAGKTSTNRGSYRQGKDHPRGCGENMIAAYRDALTKGSPPRMRGKHEVTANFGGVERITPADAGKTRSESTAPAGGADHPRGCGENCIVRNRC